MENRILYLSFVFVSALSTSSMAWAKAKDIAPRPPQFSAIDLRTRIATINRLEQIQESLRIHNPHVRRIGVVDLDKAYTHLTTPGTLTHPGIQASDELVTHTERLYQQALNDIAPSVRKVARSYGDQHWVLQGEGRPDRAIKHDYRQQVDRMRKERFEFPADAGDEVRARIEDNRQRWKKMPQDRRQASFMRDYLEQHYETNRSAFRLRQEAQELRNILSAYEDMESHDPHVRASAMTRLQSAPPRPEVLFIVDKGLKDRNQKVVAAARKQQRTYNAESWEFKRQWPKNGKAATLNEIYMGFSSAEPAAQKWALDAVRGKDTPMARQIRRMGIVNPNNYTVAKTATDDLGTILAKGRQKLSKFRPKKPIRLGLGGSLMGAVALVGIASSFMNDDESSEPLASVSERRSKTQSSDFSSSSVDFTPPVGNGT